MYRKENQYFKMKIQYFLFPALMLLLQNVQSSQPITMGLTEGIYWRPYNGTIPNDAYPANSISGPISYIGRGNVWNGGLYIGELFPNATNITVSGQPKPHVHVISENIEVLCTSSPTGFGWVLRQTGDKISDDLPSLVQGGYEFEGARPLFVGRSSDHGSGLYVFMPSKVTLNEPERDAYDSIWFPDGTVQGNASIFQLLHKDRPK